MHMSRVLASCVIAVLMLAASPVSAQQPAVEDIKLGIELGLTRASLTSPDIDDFFEAHSGIIIGGWASGTLRGPLGYMAELSYVAKNSGNTNLDDINFGYLEIPVLVRYNLGQTTVDNGVIFYPLFGPVFDFRLKTDLNDVDVKDQFNGTDVGLIAGVGVEQGRWGLELRMSWGLTSLQKEGFETFFGLTDLKSRTFQILGKVRLY